MGTRLNNPLDLTGITGLTNPLLQDLDMNSFDILNGSDITINNINFFDGVTNHTLAISPDYDYAFYTAGTSSTLSSLIDNYLAMSSGYKVIQPGGSDIILTTMEWNNITTQSESHHYNGLKIFVQESGLGVNSNFEFTANGSGDPQLKMEGSTGEIYHPTQLKISSPIINFGALPTSPAGLPSGSVWKDTTGGLNILKVV